MIAFPRDTSDNNVCPQLLLEERKSIVPANKRYMFKYIIEYIVLNRNIYKCTFYYRTCQIGIYLYTIFLFLKITTYFYDSFSQITVNYVIRLNLITI